MNYFRAILLRREHSERALALTEEAARVACSNYAVWQFRREILEALGTDLTHDLELAAELLADHPKTYQLWYHREALVRKLNKPLNELEFCAQAVEEDSKNYHAWAYRFVLSFLGGARG